MQLKADLALRFIAEIRLGSENVLSLLQGCAESAYDVIEEKTGR